MKFKSLFIFSILILFLLLNACLTIPAAPVGVQYESTFEPVVIPGIASATAAAALSPTVSPVPTGTKIPPTIVGVLDPRYQGYSPLTGYMTGYFEKSQNVPVIEIRVAPNCEFLRSIHIELLQTYKKLTALIVYAVTTNFELEQELLRCGVEFETKGVRVAYIVTLDKTALPESVKLEDIITSTNISEEEAKEAIAWLLNLHLVH